MVNREYILGIDTSNYKTSVAIVDKEGNIISDIRQLLTVKQGDRGLRQSSALFQHIENLPDIIEETFSREMEGKIRGIAVSSRPRPIAGSYMPVFKAGISLGKSLAAAMRIPYMEFSHQEGHIEAIKYYSPFRYDDEVLCYHLSGGTCELLNVKRRSHSKMDIDIIGASRDISFGQVIDRVGVFIGMQFPAGEEMDRIILNTAKASRVLKPISIADLSINLSGIETQCTRALKSSSDENKYAILKELFDKFASCLIQLTEEAFQKTKIKRVLFAGGVSSSKYLKNKLTEYFDDNRIQLAFGSPALSQDNAIGTALLGGARLWQ